MATAIEGETRRMSQVLAAQKASFTAAMPESLAVRTDRLDRAIALLVDNAEDFAKAVSEDFGHRSREQTPMTDIITSGHPLTHPKQPLAALSTGQKGGHTFPPSLSGPEA